MSLYPLKGSNHGQAPRLEVNCVPFQTAYFASPEAGKHGESVDVAEACSMGQFQKVNDRWDISHSHLFLLAPGRRSSIRYVPGEKPPLNSMAQGFP